MESGSGLFRGAVSNILKYNLPENTLLYSDADGKIAAYELGSDYLVYLANLRGNIQDQIDAKWNQTYLEGEYYTRVQVDDIISELLGSAPDQLNTLNELALALNNDANFGTSAINLINTKANIVDVYDKTYINFNYFTKNWHHHFLPQ